MCILVFIVQLYGKGNVNGWVEGRGNWSLSAAPIWRMGFVLNKRDMQNASSMKKSMIAPVNRGETTLIN